VILEKGKIKDEYRRDELFDNVDKLKRDGLEMPVIMELLVRLQERGVRVVVKKWSIDAVIDELIPLIFPQKNE
jgi:hypothetical protein